MSRNSFELDPLYLVPTEEISCPGCGLRYGWHKRRVCANCEECSKCCRCAKGEQNLAEANDYITKVILQ